LTSESNLEKGLNELRVNEGINLYLEDASERRNASGAAEDSTPSATKWEHEFELEVNRYQIKYNKLGSTQYTESAIVDRRCSVEQLKL